MAFGLLVALWFGLVSACVLPSGHESQRLPSADPATLARLAQPILLANFDAALAADAIYFETNKVRAELGLRPFARLARLDRAADIQASSNALAGVASHDNIITAWATPLARVQDVGLKPATVSENAALLPTLDLKQGYYERATPEGKTIMDAQTGQVARPHTYASFAQAVVQAWMMSPGHRANIVNPKLRILGCNARPTKTVTGFDMLVGIQVFYTPADG